MAERGYRPTRQRPMWGRLVVVLLAVVAFGVGTFAAGRVSAPAAPAPAPRRTGTAGIVWRHGLPDGFAHTPRGAGTAAARYVALISDWTGRDPGWVRPRLAELVTDPDLVDELMPEPIAEGNHNIAGDVPLRVWTAAGSGTGPAPGGPIEVRVYELGVYGPRSDGHTPPDAGLSGGFHVVSMHLAWERGRWRISGWQLDDAPAPAVASDDADLPAELVGPDSWTPDTR